MNERPRSDHLRPPVTAPYLSAAEVFALARQVAEGMSEAQVAAELGVAQSSSHRMLAGRMSYYRLALRWLEQRGVCAVERGEDGEAVRYVRALEAAP